MAAKARKSRTFRQKLLEAVERVDRPGSVCVGGDKPLVLPGLEVEGVGAIRLPLGKTQARKLIKQCSQAPYGQGTETLVDTDVRRVWELDPEQFQLTNPQWDELVSSITGEVQAGLGLEDRNLKAHLYKLLVYEKDNFFLPHRDGEKLNGMVATLVISLPSVHKGGELIVSHEGQQQKIAFEGAASGYELSYAAFYADCEHEVLPVRAGYRLSLVYNLTLAKSRRKSGISAPRTGEVVASLRDLFHNWPSKGSEGELSKLAIALEHQYSQEGLKIDTLKGVDRAQAEVLLEAAEQADCVAHLALVTHWQSGSAEGGDYGYSYGYGNYKSWSCDDEEELDEGTGYEMGEVFEESLTIDHWSDRKGHKVSLGRIYLSKDEIVSNRPPEAWELSREEFEGFTGNAGMTLERWYHRAAVVVWPQKNHFQVLCDSGTDAAIAGLESMVKKWKRAVKSKKDAQRESCLEFAKAIINTWGPRRYSLYFYERGEETDRSIFPRLLQELDEPELLRQFLIQIVPEESEIQLGKTFPPFCKKHGWQTFEEALASIMEASSAGTISRNASLLERLCLVRDKNADRIKLCRELGGRVVAALEKLDNASSVDPWKMRQVDRASLLTSLVKSLIAVEANSPLRRLLNHALSETERYDLTDVHLKTIITLESWLTRQVEQLGPAVRKWLSHCRSELEQRTAEAPAPPADFRRAAELSCRCPLCRELSEFLADPEESVHRFPVNKDRRKHLHQIIDRHGCDVTHVTSRKGRPYTLVCTKTTASYEKACKIYERDQKNLKRLEAIEQKIGRPGKN